VSTDPLDEYEATLREARARWDAPEPAAGQLEAEERLLRRLRDELAEAVKEASERARHEDGF
jgi:hypothetical protein